MRLIMMTVLILGAASAQARLVPNIHEVDTGQLWRSAQLNQNELTELIKKAGIKSIINLRGAHPSERWYVEEIGVAAQLGVKHVSIGMSASRLPHREDLILLMDSFRSLPRPILIHCQAGADRSGEAAALYAMEFMGLSKNNALKQLTLRYHHSRILKPAKFYFVNNVYQGEDWARNEYDPCSANYEYYDKEKYCKKTKRSNI